MIAISFTPYVKNNTEFALLCPHTGVCPGISILDFKQGRFEVIFTNEVGIKKQQH